MGCQAKKLRILDLLKCLISELRGRPSFASGRTALGEIDVRPAEFFGVRAFFPIRNAGREFECRRPGYLFRERLPKSHAFFDGKLIAVGCLAPLSVVCRAQEHDDRGQIHPQQ